MFKRIKEFFVSNYEENQKYLLSNHIKDDYRELLSERLQAQIDIKKANEKMYKVENKLEEVEINYGHILFGA